MRMQNAMTAKILLLSLILNLAFLTFNSYAQDRGPLVSMELRDVDLKDVLRALGQEHRINIIVDEKVTGKVTVSLRNVLLWDAIESILKDKGYKYIMDGNIVRVVPITEDEELVTHTFEVKYVNPKDIEGIVKKVLSKRGDVASDPKSNTIIIKDLPGNIPKAEALIRTLDVIPPQVMIDARIVEANRNIDRSIGIQWGGDYRSGALSLEGATDTDSLVVNLPAELPGVSTTPFGALKIGLITGGFGGIVNLDMRLSAMEQSGDAKLLSNPRILTANNKKATISTGEKIRIPSVEVVGGAAAGGTEEIEATLKLEVTPQITPDGKIMLSIMTKKEEFDWSRTVMGIPAKNIREATTEVTINDGDTLVIGGIFTKTEIDSERRVPFLSKIPILGWLFKREDSFSDVKELMIFITPTIKTGSL